MIDGDDRRSNMTEEKEKIPVCSICGDPMCHGVVAVRLNRYCIKQMDGWYCPKHATNRVTA